MRSLSQFLGVEEDVVFKFKDEPFNYVVKNGCLMKFISLEGGWELSKLTLENSKLKEIVIPVVSKTFKSFEIELCKNVGNMYKDGYISRDKSGRLFMYELKPSKNGLIWGGGGNFVNLDAFEQLFQSIQWEDEKPTKISDIVNSKGE